MLGRVHNAVAELTMRAYRVRMMPGRDNGLGWLNQGGRRVRPRLVVGRGPVVGQDSGQAFDAVDLGVLGC